MLNIHVAAVTVKPGLVISEINDFGVGCVLVRWRPGFTVLQPTKKGCYLVPEVSAECLNRLKIGQVKKT
jgi:hypothetical protein